MVESRQPLQRCCIQIATAKPKGLYPGNIGSESFCCPYMCKHQMYVLFTAQIAMCTSMHSLSHAMMVCYRCKGHGTGIRIAFAKEVTDSIDSGGEIPNLVQLLSWDGAEKTKHSSSKIKQKKCMGPAHEFSAKTLSPVTVLEAGNERVSCQQNFAYN